MGEHQDALLRLRFGFSRAAFPHSSCETQAGGTARASRKTHPLSSFLGRKGSGRGAVHPAAGARAKTQQGPFITADGRGHRTNLKASHRSAGDEGLEHQAEWGRGRGRVLLLITGNDLFYILLLVWFCCE